MFSSQERQALLSALREDHVIALPPEKCVEETPNAQLIINHQNLRHATPSRPRVDFCGRGNAARCQEISLFTVPRASISIQRVSVDRDIWIYLSCTSLADAMT